MPITHCPTWLSLFLCIVQVSFIIPVFNQLAHTQACVESLRPHTPATIPHEVILVDDGSDAETQDYLRSLPPPFRCLFNESNQGFAVSTNRGAREASGEWLCLLNNDTELTPGALEAMLAVRTAHPDAGIIGSVQVTTDGSTVDHAGIDFIDGGYPRHRRIELASLASEPDYVAVPAVTAACCLVPRHWFVTMGGLDESYRNGFEDVDLCLRAREAGWKIYVANRAIIKHAVSTSEGRGAHEFRNARRFLSRWGPRTAAIENEERSRAARAYREDQAARAITSPELPAAVKAVHQTTLAQAEARTVRETSPTIVWVDLLRMQPGGANGGIKPYVYAFLREMGALTWPKLKFVVLAQAGLGSELSFLRSDDVVALKSKTAWSVSSAETTIAELESKYPPQVLYCPFAVSSFARPDLPLVALIVDLLHRDLPSALPIEEVNFREDTIKRVVGSATWLQSLAHHGSDRLVHHYGVHPTQCFHTYIPAHDRLPVSTRDQAAPSADPFFFYPANFWSHKNHEVLLTAYRIYQHNAGADAWPLVLTGHPDARMASLLKLATALGLADKVQFRGHVPDQDFANLWRDASALVFPSLHEGFGIPLVESFHHGVPVIAAQNSALPEVGGDACLWFNPASPEALAQCLGQVAQDAPLREKLVAAGRRQLNRFSLHFEASRLAHFLHAAAHNLVP